MTEQMERITKILLQSRGIDISKYDETFLFKSIRKRFTDTNCSTLEQYFGLLKQNDTETGYFYRFTQYKL